MHGRFSIIGAHPRAAPKVYTYVLSDYFAYFDMHESPSHDFCLYAFEDNIGKQITL